MQAAAVYARLSSDRDLNAASIDVQIEACRAEAKRQGFEVPDHLVFIDRNLSASKRGTVRPGYDSLLAAFEAGTVDTVFVRETSRLYRQPAELERLIELVEGKGVTVHALFSGEIDLDRGLLEARIRVAVDAEESHKLSQRVRLAKAARRAAGAPNGGGRRPYGYQRTPEGFEVNPLEATRIREATQRILTGGESLCRIIVDWNTHGVTTAEGGRWTPARLRRILVGSPARYRETPLITGGSSWPALISPDEAALLRSRLTGRPKQLTGRRYPLTGLLLCDLCGTKLVGSGGLYRCSPVSGGCGRVSIKSYDLEDHLLARIDSRRTELAEGLLPLPDEGPPPLQVDSELQARLLSQLRAVEGRLTDVGEAIAAGTLSVPAGIAAETGLVQQVQRLQNDLAATGPAAPPRRSGLLLYDPGVEEWAGRWGRGELTAMEIVELHEEVAAWTAAVRISPRTDRRKKFNSERVAIAWRPLSQLEPQ